VVPYSMVEQDRDARKNGIVQRKYYNAFFDQKINKLLEGYDPEDLPTIRKIVENPWAQEAWLGAVWGDILGSPTSRMSYGLSINQMAEEDLKYVMVFQSGTKKSMNQQKEVIEKHCPEHHVLVLHGDMPGMNNKTAQQLTKEKIVELQYGMIPGKSKLLVLTNMMGSRSYTVGEIQAVIFMQDGGDIDTFIQKSSRVLSPHPGKKFGHIFDFAFDSNKTRNSELAIVHDAVLTQNIVGGSFPQAIRQVLNSVKLYDMGRGGWQNDDQLVASLEDNNKLLALANSSNRLDIKDLSAQQLDILSKIQNSFTDKEKKKLKHIMTGKTFKSTGRVGKGDMDMVLKQVRKAIQSLNNSATSVVWFADKQGDTFADCIERIKNNKEATADFTKVIGITPAEVQQLIPILPTNIYDICVKNSKNGQAQKYATNKSIGILGQADPKELWREIISHAVMDARIRYAMKNHGKILVVAGGHGTEIEVMIEKYGKDIIKNIWFNDNIISFANEIKFKYNNINIVKGNFLELNIDMKFDVIVGNPPYQNPGKSKGEKLWYRFIFKSLDLLKNDGYLGFITPNSWMSGGVNLSSGKKGVFKDIFKKYQLKTATVSGVTESYFPKIGIDISWWLLNKVPVNSTTKIITKKNSFDIDFRNVEFLSPVPESMSIKIIEKTLSKNIPKIDVKYFQKTIKKGTRVESKKKTKKCSFEHWLHGDKKNKTLETIFLQNKNSVDLEYKKICIPMSSRYWQPYFDSKGIGVASQGFAIRLKDKDTYEGFLSVYHSKIFTYLNFNLQIERNGFMKTSLVRNLPDIDLSKKWNDKLLYKYFDLTKEEINYVETNVKSNN
jgi:adenine-specific DNA-methyltransferase